MRYRDVCLEALGCELPPFVASTESIFERITPTLERLKIPVESVVGASGVEEIRFGPKTPTVADTATRAAFSLLYSFMNVAIVVESLVGPYLRSNENFIGNAPWTGVGVPGCIYGAHLHHVPVFCHHAGFLP